MLADVVTVQQRDGPVADLEQLDQQRIRDRRLARSRQPGEEDRDALLVARWIGSPQFADDLGVREPRRDLQTLLQAPPEFRTGDVQQRLVFAGLVDRQVLGALLHVDHQLERHHRDVELFRVFHHDLLRVVRPVERLASRVVAGARVIAADDEVRAAVVLADDRVPQRLARPGHAHREVQQAQLRGLLGILLQDLLVAAHARVVIDVARLRHADHRMDQQVRLVLLRRPEGQLLVRAMHRVAGLECDHLAPAKLLETRAHLGRRIAEAAEVVVHRRLDAA